MAEEFAEPRCSLVGTYRNCLEKEGLLDDPARLVKLRVKDLLRIHAFGAASVLDLSCVAEAVLTAGRSRPPEPSNVVADILYLIEHDWAEQISSDDPRFARHDSGWKWDTL